jgi:hypothetical protein
MITQLISTIPLLTTTFLPDTEMTKSALDQTNAEVRAIAQAAKALESLAVTLKASVRQFKIA